MELPYFQIGGSYGGNQDWMTDPWMKLGGCAALTAVDSCIWLTLFRKMKRLCPVDAYRLTETAYVNFANVMKPYLRPRFQGVNRLELYTEGFGAYLRDWGCSVPEMDTLTMGTPVTTAEAAVKKQIGEGFPIPTLHLMPMDPSVRQYEWHWFLLTGWRDTSDGTEVKAVTYGKAEWVRLERLWNERDPKNGGLILYRDRAPAENS